MKGNNKDFTLLVVHAHPDDEAISTGGILAKYSAQGVNCIVLYGTRGEAGSIQNPEFVAPSPDLNIEEVRAQELEKALKVLHVREALFLGYRDSGMVGSPDNLDPRAFIQADMAEATNRLVEIIRLKRPHIVITYNERGAYGHPDHVMAHRVTVLAFHASGDPGFRTQNGLEPWRPCKLYYTAIPKARLTKIYDFMRARGEQPPFNPDFLGTPDEKVTTRINVMDYLPIKMEALYCHQSQLGPHNFFRRVPDDLRNELLGFEHFVCAHGCNPTNRQESDLLEGLS